MKKLLNISILLLAAAALFACQETETEKPVPINTFTLECEAPEWNDGVLTLPADKITIKVHVVHDISANAWAIRCDLDDAWTSFTTYNDDLYITAKANTGKAERSTWVEVVIGEEVSRITINQDFNFVPAYNPKPSILPETVWKDGETIWR